MSDQVWLVFGYNPNGEVHEFMGTTSEVQEVDEDLSNPGDEMFWTKMVEDDIQLPENMLHGKTFTGRVLKMLSDKGEVRPIVGCIERTTKPND